MTKQHRTSRVIRVAAQIQGVSDRFADAIPILSRALNDTRRIVAYVKDDGPVRSY